MGALLRECNPAPDQLQRRKQLIADLKSCKSAVEGRRLHLAAVSAGEHSSVYVASTLIKMYATFGAMSYAQTAFDNVQHPDVMCWTALILGYADNGNRFVALELFLTMKQQGCAQDGRAFVAAFKALTNISEKEQGDGKLRSRERGKAVHLLAASCGCDNSFVKAILVDMYAKSSCMEDARRVFKSLRHPDVVSVTALIMGYADNGASFTALHLFSETRQTCSARTFVAALKACTDLAVQEVGSLVKVASKERGKAVHMLASRAGHDLNIYVQGTLVDMYAKCGVMADARRVFDRMKEADIVCWNALMVGYVDNGLGEIALQMFSRMGLEGFAPQERAFVAALKVCTETVKQEGNVKASQERGKALHILASREGCDSGIHLQGTLVDMYAKCGGMHDALKVFSSIKNPDVVCWNALILGYVDNGLSEMALLMFSRMEHLGCLYDSTTLVAALKASGMLGSLEIGRSVHARITSCGFHGDKILWNAVVDFYARCGSLMEPKQVFDAHTSRDLVTWNALMTGFSPHGDTQGVLDLFEKMQQQIDLQPDGINFNCIFTACSHAGLVDKGKDYYEVMIGKYGINPRNEHYNCIFDMPGRGSKLDDALAFLRSMKVSPTSVTWTTVLGACRKCNNVQLARLAFQSLTSLEEDTQRTNA